MNINYVLFDQEVTCWETESLFRRNEMIETGAVLLSYATLEPISEFQYFVMLEDYTDLDN